MPAGRITYVIECIPTGTTGNSVTPCVTLAGVRHSPQMVQAYLVDTSTGPFLEGLIGPFDYVGASSAWAFGFTLTLFWFVIAKPIGLMFKLIKQS